eukprot:6481983-Pyramimonas_sp.AAC.1
MESELAAVRKSIAERKPAVTRHTTLGRKLAKRQQQLAKLEEEATEQLQAIKDAQEALAQARDKIQAVK